MSISLSVNVNKIATLRNARGGNLPNLIKAVKKIESFGADGITVHPRPDERHIRYADVYDLKKVLTTELNIEGNPKVPQFVDLVLAVCPHQVTLVPDSPNQLTSNHGWNMQAEVSYLTQITQLFQNHGIRVSVFIDPIVAHIPVAKKIGINRVELYTEQYAKQFEYDPKKAIEPYIATALLAKDMNIDINAGHDLNLDNLTFFAKSIPFVKEVSIGHALIADALYMGLEKTINCYKDCL
ncbi:MAG: pyridoxine 5'-phosphate synthase [Phycisphaerales bacterium]|nr:pyridoxine 5'-phosphate synthase [Phycisphaerales bacterium]